MVEEIDFPDQIFIGGIDYNMQEDEFIEEVKSWGNIIKVYYRGPTSGWGTATFSSPQERTRFLAKGRFVLGNKVVDVKAFKKPKYKPAQGTTAPAYGGSNYPPLQASSLAASKPAPSAAPPGMVTAGAGPRTLLPGASTAKTTQQQTSAAAAGSSTALTGVILRYTSPNFGVIRTNNHGNGILSADAVYLCSNPDHNLGCKTADCATYTKLTAPKRPRKSLFAALPVGTQISFYCRPLEIDDYNFQATVAWPQLSKKPSGATPPTAPYNESLDEQLRQFLSSEDSRADDTDSREAPQRKVSSQSNATLQKNAISSSQSSSQQDEDIILDDSDLLDDLDLDIELDHLKGITSFLQILGVQTEGLSLTPLINKLVAIKHEGEAVNQIMDFFNKNGVPIDESRKRNLIANYRTLLHSLRITTEPSAPTSRTATPPMSDPSNMDESYLAERFCQFLIKETTPEYFRWIHDKKTVEKHCRTVLNIWASKGYSISRLTAEYRECQRNGSQEYLENRWRRELDTPIVDPSLACLIEPIKIFELTILFFQRDSFFNLGNGITSSMTRSSSGASISSNKSSMSAVLPRKSVTPPAALTIPSSNGDRRASMPFLSEIGKLVVPSPPDTLKPLGSHIKTNHLVDGQDAEELKNLLENDTDYKSFSAFVTWLNSNYASTSSSSPATVDNQIMFVFNIVKAWTSSHKSMNDIRDIFRKHISEPKLLFANWAHFVKISNEPMVATDAILKTTFNFCLDNLPVKQKSVDSSEITQLFQNVTCVEPTLADPESGGAAVSSSAFFNLRGFVLHNFNEDYGLIQTPVGRVLFERNIAYCIRDSSWKRCKSKDQMLTSLTPVKLHARVARLKWQRRNQTDLSLLYATKVWVWNESSSEPYTGTTLLGRETYWTQAVKEFENIAKANPILIYNSSDKIRYEEDYRQTFSLAVRNRNSSNSSTIAQSTNGEQDADNMGYDPFRQYLASNASDYKENKKSYTASIRTFSRSLKFSNFHNLRKRFLLHSILDTLESFEEMLETHMIFSEQNEVNPSHQCDIVPHLVVFFSSKDPITEAQLQEQKKNVARNIKGSVNHLEDILNQISNLLEHKSIPLPQTSGVLINNFTGTVNKENQVEKSFLVSQSEWNALLSKIDELQLWKEKKISEDEMFQKKVQESFMSLFEDVTSLSKQVKMAQKAGESATLAAESTAAQIAASSSFLRTSVGSVSSAKNGVASKNIFVKITAGGTNEIHEFPTDENGNLQVESVLAVYQGTTALKYSSDIGTTRICRKIGDIFEQPENGWEDKIYTANISNVNQPPLYRPPTAGMSFQPPPGNFGGMSGGLSGMSGGLSGMSGGMSGMSGMYGNLSPGNLIRPNMVPTSLAGYSYYPSTM